MPARTIAVSRLNPALTVQLAVIAFVVKAVPTSVPPQVPPTLSVAGCGVAGLMSLAPALHIAALDAAQIHDSLAQAITREHWQEQMPTNALLISGPSKTADIELVLTFGVHGPKELIVLILDD